MDQNLTNKGEKEAPGLGTVDLESILDRISSLYSSVDMLQVQAEKEKQLTPLRTRPTSPYRKEPTQARQVGIAKLDRMSHIRESTP